MKTILSALACVALFAFAADAQQISRYSGEQTTSYNGGTNTTPAVSTNRFFSIDVPRAAGEVAIFVNYSFVANQAAGDGPLLMRLYRGIDSGKYETNAYLTWSIPTNSSGFTTPISTILTTNVSGIPYLRAQLINPSTNATGRTTNVYVSYGFKN